MKKNKIKTHLDHNIKKEKVTFICLNIITYLIIFGILTLVSSITISRLFYREAKGKISTLVEQMNVEKNVNRLRLTDERMIIVFFPEDEAITPIIYGMDTRISYSNKILEIDERFFDKYLFETIATTTNGVEEETIENVRYLTYTTNVDFMVAREMFSDARIHVTTAKICVNIAGETYVNRQISKVYIICVATILILCLVAAYLLSMETIKPLIASLNKHKSFVSDASHELRTPLAIVQSKLENILTQGDKTVYDVSEDLAVSLNEITRLTKLTSDLLVLAKSDNEKIELEITEIDLQKSIFEISEAFKEMAEMEDKVFVYNSKEVTAHVDKNRINQLMIIFLDNALRYTNAGDTISINLTTDGNDIIIEVVDTGIGISDYTKDHIFERFYREDKARSRASGGNGLGLSIAQTIVKLHHGKIYVDHNKPKGTKFTVILPNKVSK